VELVILKKIKTDTRNWIKLFFSGLPSKLCIFCIWLCT